MNWRKTFGVFLLLQIPILLGALLVRQPVFMVPGATVASVLYIAYLLASQQPIRNVRRLWTVASAAVVATTVGFGISYFGWLFSRTPYGAERPGDWLVGLIVLALFYGATVVLMTTVFAFHYLLSRSWKQPERKDAV